MRFGKYGINVIIVNFNCKSRDLKRETNFTENIYVKSSAFNAKVIKRDGCRHVLTMTFNFFQQNESVFLYGA